MSANVCTRCTRECGDAYVCRECTHAATENLRHIADLADAFDEKRARVRSSWDVSNLGAAKPAVRWRTDDSQRTTFAATTGFRPSAALSFDPRVSRVQHRVQNALVGIARDVLDHHDDGTLHRDAKPATIARWAMRHTKWLRLQPEAGDTFDTIERILGDLHHLFDNPPPALFLGECKAEFEDGECTESLYLDREKITSDTVSCPRCGITHDINERRATLMAGVNEYLGTAKEISHLLRNIAGTDVSDRRIREYATHGLLTRMGSRREYDREGRARDVATYRIGDVREIVTKLEERRAARKASTIRREQRVG